MWNNAFDTVARFLHSCVQSTHQHTHSCRAMWCRLQAHSIIINIEFESFVILPCTCTHTIVSNLSQSVCDMHIFINRTRAQIREEKKKKRNERKNYKCSLIGHPPKNYLSLARLLFLSLSAPASGGAAATCLLVSSFYY